MSTHRPSLQPSPPSESALREAALRHLARYAATRARLLRVLHRRVDRWAAAARAAMPDRDDVAAQSAAAKQAASRVVAALAAAKAVDDAAYAASRAGALLRAGKSRARVARHLAERGIDKSTIDAAVFNNPDQELAGALLLARRRRIGPFAPSAAPMDATARQRALGILARAGFSHATAARALRTGVAEAEARIERLRLGS